VRLPILYEDRKVATTAADAGEVWLDYQAGRLEAPDHFPVSLTMPLAEAGCGQNLGLP